MCTKEKVGLNSAWKNNKEAVFIKRRCFPIFISVKRG
jgi:hypothetical protein